MNKCPCTILIVDDDPDDLFFIARAFRAVGVKDTIHAVLSGGDAISYMMGNGRFADRREFAFPDLVTTDLNMNGMSGFDVLAQFQKSPAWAVVPRAVLSSSRDPKEIEKAYQLGACSYLVKSDDFKDLCQSLKALYDYWRTCEDPNASKIGRHLHLENEGKRSPTPWPASGINAQTPPPALRPYNLPVMSGKWLYA